MLVRFSSNASLEREHAQKLVDAQTAQQAIGAVLQERLLELSQLVARIKAKQAGKNNAGITPADAARVAQLNTEVADLRARNADATSTVRQLENHDHTIAGVQGLQNEKKALTVTAERLRRVGADKSAVQQLATNLSAVRETVVGSSTQVADAVQDAREDRYDGLVSVSDAQQAPEGAASLGDPSLDSTTTDPMERAAAILQSVGYTSGVVPDTPAKPRAKKAERRAPALPAPPATAPAPMPAANAAAPVGTVANRLLTRTHTPSSASDAAAQRLYQTVSA